METVVKKEPRDDLLLAVEIKMEVDDADIDAELQGPGYQCPILGCTFITDFQVRFAVLPGAWYLTVYFLSFYDTTE
jgi:hypothetical protein